MDLYQQLIVPFAARLELERLPLVEDSDDHKSVIEAANFCTNLAQQVLSYNWSICHIIIMCVCSGFFATGPVQRRDRVADTTNNEWI